MNNYKKASVSARFLPLAAVGAFLIGIFEMIFMGGPFAAYFYGVYSPFLSWTQSSPYLIWLSDFFIPHLSTPKSSLFLILTRAPRYLLHIGLASFVIHAAYLYWVKFVKKGVATRLLYRYVRHPQYLSFAIAGVGLVFHWPRFINIILFFLMLFAYYALARSEEARMERRHGGAYRAYKEKTAMFFPGRAGERVMGVTFGWLPQTPLRGYVALLSVFGIALAGSVLLRAASVRNLHYEILPEAPHSLVVFLKALPAGVEPGTIRAKLAELSGRAAAKKGSFRVFYVLTEKGDLHHLLVDSGITYQALTRGELPEASWYLVQGLASYCSTAT